MDEEYHAMPETAVPLRIVPVEQWFAEMARERDAWRTQMGYRGAYKPVKHRCDTCDHPVAPDTAYVVTVNVYLCRRHERRIKRIAYSAPITRRDDP